MERKKLNKNVFDGSFVKKSADLKMEAGALFIKIGGGKKTVAHTNSKKKQC